MSYEPHLIAPNKSGLQKDLQPWLIPDDAQAELLDGYIHHGVIHKRDGYNFLANGLQSGAPYCESRVVRASSVTLDGTLDGVNKTFTNKVLDPFLLPIRRGTVIVSSATPSQTVTDDGIGSLSGNGTGSINYTTGVLTVVFTTAPTATQPTVTYDYHPGEAVMMIATFTNASNVKELVIADTDFLNIYNLTSNRLDDITFDQFTGDSHDFFTWMEYPTVVDNPRLLFTNNVDQIQYYDGTAVENFFPITASQTGAQQLGDGTNSVGPYTITLADTPVVPGSLVIVAAASQTVTDRGDGVLEGNGTGTVNYRTGDVSVTFISTVPNGTGNITYDFEYATDYVITASKILNFKDRAILLRPTYLGGKIYPQRIQIGGTGQGGDDFRLIRLDGVTSLQLTPGVGVIDIPTGEWIQGAAYNRDDVMIFTENETWMLKYTGNDIVPFTLDKIDGSRGNKAPFAPISYLNMTKAYSPKALTVSDGYQVVRYDDKIPEFSYEDIDSENFDLCFSGAVDDDHNHYLIHPSPTKTKSDNILVNNYDENTFAIYRIPLSCMGNFFEGYDVSWSYLTEENGFPDWNSFAQEYATWNAIGYSKDAPITVGGGHNGEIWRLNSVDGEDNPLRVYGITVDSSSPLNITVTSDWHNYVIGDKVFFAGITDPAAITAESYGLGDGSVGPYTHVCLNKQIIPTSVTVTADPGGTPQVLTDDGSGVLSGDGTGAIDYLNGQVSATFDAVVDEGDTIEIAYTYEYELNSKEGNVTAVPSTTTFSVEFVSSNPQSISTYVSGGVVSRNIPFEFVTKNFNPYAQAGMKVRCGWIYFYLDAAKTNATGVQNTPLSSKIEVEVFTNDRWPDSPTQVTEIDFPYTINTSNFDDRASLKVWRKVYINQNARFVQFRVKNAQQGTRIRIHALQPGFAPGGRMI